MYEGITHDTEPLMMPPNVRKKYSYISGKIWEVTLHFLTSKLVRCSPGWVPVLQGTEFNS